MIYNELNNEQKAIVDTAMIEITGYGHILPDDADIRFNIKGYDQQYFLNKFGADYNTGILTVLTAPKRSKVGHTIGHVANHNVGYVSCSIGSATMAQLHQVIFFMKYGFTTKEIHHYDNNKTNNSIKNLSPSSRRHNLSHTTRGASGILNISPSNLKKYEWVYTHKANKVNHFRGFSTLADAITYRDEHRASIGFPPANDNPSDAYLEEYNQAQAAIAFAEIINKYAA